MWLITERVTIVDKKNKQTPIKFEGSSAEKLNSLLIVQLQNTNYLLNHRLNHSRIVVSPRTEKKSFVGSPTSSSDPVLFDGNASVSFVISGANCSSVTFGTCSSSATLTTIDTSTAFSAKISSSVGTLSSPVREK